MIKIGCAAYSYRDYLKDGRMSYEDFIEEVYKIGLDGVEMTLYWLPSREPSYFRNLKRIALSRGLPISCAGISTNFCNPDPREREKMIKTVEEGLGIARELGAPALRVFGGHVPEGYSEEQAIRWTVEALSRCITYAEENGIVIALENHGGVTARADNVVRIVESVGSPWLRVNLDLGNYKESMYEDIAKTVPYAVHIHGKVSVSENIKVDYEKIRRILGDNSYNGFISIEYEEKEDPKKGVPEFAKYLLRMF
ncbi:MAG: sugar phosphate isomerase/epimerase [Crenarchaeota archaeon]|nr:sugar phosphate isomerase/epimerase [Thermoproteota archaeon]